MLNLQLTSESLPMTCILVVAIIVGITLFEGDISEQVIIVPFASAVIFSENITELSGKFRLPS